MSPGLGAILDCTGGPCRAPWAFPRARCAAPGWDWQGGARYCTEPPHLTATLPPRPARFSVLAPPRELFKVKPCQEKGLASMTNRTCIGLRLQSPAFRKPCLAGLDKLAPSASKGPKFTSFIYHVHDSLLRFRDQGSVTEVQRQPGIRRKYFKSPPGRQIRRICVLWRYWHLGGSRGRTVQYPFI